MSDAKKPGEALQAVPTSHCLEVLVAGWQLAEALKELGDGHDLGDGKPVLVAVGQVFPP